MNSAHPSGFLERGQFVKERARISLFALLALIGTLLPGNSAFAEGYSVDFGADTDLGRDAGTVECQFGEFCIGKLEALDLTVRFAVAKRAF